MQDKGVSSALFKAGFLALQIGQMHSKYLINFSESMMNEHMGGRTKYLNLSVKKLVINVSTFTKTTKQLLTTKNQKWSKTVLFENWNI